VQLILNETAKGGKEGETKGTGRVWGEEET
jgi:hypothetical protein